MKIAIITDTWNAINGVVTTLRATQQELKRRGHEVLVVEPSQFKHVGLPWYKDVKLSINLFLVSRLLNKFCPDAIHIATEGPLGLAARLYCNNHSSIVFTTSYHTCFPEYMAMYGIPKSWTYAYLKWFHASSARVLVPTPSIKTKLELLGFNNLAIWSRGVDRNTFYPNTVLSVRHEPVLLCVSRVSREKNLDEFCRLPGRRVLVGDGPYLSELRSRYPDVHYVGYLQGTSLADYYRQADVFVFPSRSDTFGVVIIEALACGLPVAAYPVTGPIDIIIQGKTGYLSENLEHSIDKCLHIDRRQIAELSSHYTWSAATDVFENNLVKLK